MGGLLFYGKILLTGQLSPLISFFLLAPLGLAAYYFSWKLYHRGQKKVADIDKLFAMSLQKLKKRTKKSHKNNYKKVNDSEVYIT